MADRSDRFGSAGQDGGVSRRVFLGRGAAAGLSAASLSGLLAACGANKPATTTPGGNVGDGAGAPRRGGTVKFGLYQPDAAPDPITANSSAQYMVTQIALEYLCFPRPDYTLEPKLATKWSSTKPDEWTFELRQGVTWHDGTPFTARDVVYTFDLLTDESSGSSAVSVFEGVLSKGGTKAVDDHTVRFSLDRPYVDFPYLVSAFNYNATILPRGYKKGEFLKGGIGTGPYILRKYTSQGASFVRNAKYWDKNAAYLDTIETTVRAEDSAIVAGLQAGEIDVYPQVALNTLRILRGASGVTLGEAQSSAYRSLHMRVDREPWTDVRVRQALALSIDRDAIVKGVLGGNGTVGNDHGFAPVFPLAGGLGSAVPQRKRDIAQAKRLLAEAGHPRGLRAQLTTGQILEVPDYAVAIKQQAKEAGFDLDLKVMPAASYYGSGDKQPWLDVPMGIVDWNPRGTPSQLLAPAFLCKGVWNAPHWCDDTFTKTVTSIDAEQDQGKRKALVAKAAGIMHEQTPSVIAYWVKDVRAVRTGVQGLAAGPNTLLDVSKVWRSAA